MRKSNKCEYTIGVNTRKKRKFLRPEEAVKEAERINKLPHVIKKCVAYKCTVCHFFHVGRTHEDIPRSPLMIPQPEPEELTDAEQEVHIETPVIEDNFDWNIKKEVPNDTIPVFGEILLQVQKEMKDDKHDDFDWETDKRII